MTTLVKYDAACRALAEARTIDEVKDIRDKAEAMRVYARLAKDRTMELDAKEIRWRAECRLGEMIAAQWQVVGKAGGRPKTNSDPELVSKPTLADAGIDNKLSSRAQKYAAMGGDSFERLIARVRAADEKEEERAPLDLLTVEEKEARRAAEAAAYEARTAEGCEVADLEKLAQDGARFKVIYADPPWEFKVYSGKGKDRSADRHYNTGGLDSIKALPVQALAAEDCALLMWCVMPELQGALDVIKAWGFEYKTAGFTWVKQNKSGEGLFWGMGYWTRANAELCLLATRGSPEHIAKDVHQVIMSPIGEHSQKPAAAHERIEKLLRGPYLELYARQPRSGWTTWGNEIPRADLLPPHDPETGEIHGPLVTEDPGPTRSATDGTAPSPRESEAA